MNKKFVILKALSIVMILAMQLSACSDKSSSEYRIRNKPVDKIFKSNYYASGFEKSGNDYYYINLMEDNRNAIYMATSVPSKYVIDMDMKFQTTYKYIFNAHHGIKNIDRLKIKLYEIGADKPSKEIDLKNIIKYRAAISDTPFRTIALEGVPYFGVDIVEDKEYDGYNGLDAQYVNLITEDVLNIPRMDINWLLSRSRYLDIFSSSFLQDNMQSAPFITSMYYWQDCVKLSFTTDKLPNNTKLYEKFPDLKQKLEGLNGQKARLEVVLTGNPSYEDIMELIMEDGREVVFNNITISAEDSVDGIEHEVHSFDDWRQYYRLDEVDMSLVSPIIPRDVKD